MSVDTTCASPVEGVPPPSVADPQLSTPDPQPSFPRQPGGTLRAFGALWLSSRPGQPDLRPQTRSPVMLFPPGFLIWVFAGVFWCTLVISAPRNGFYRAGKERCPALSSAAVKNDLLHYFPPMLLEKHFVLPVRRSVGFSEACVKT